MVLKRGVNDFLCSRTQSILKAFTYQFVCTCTTEVVSNVNDPCAKLKTLEIKSFVLFYFVYYYVKSKFD